MAHVVYASAYGSARDYATELARQLTASAVDYEALGADAVTDLVARLRATAEPVVAISYTHGPVLPAATFLADNDFGACPLAAVAVGMSLPAAARRRDQMKALLGSKAERVTRFYLPGRLNYSELSSAHAAVMFGVINTLKLKPRKTDNDRAMIDGYNRDVDRVDLSELAPVVAWARGEHRQA